MQSTITKSDELLNALRKNIVRGVYRPGHRLPTRLEIGEEFGVGVSTIQRALDKLMETGFVESRARAGTFVVDHPPHLSNFGLVISTAGAWSRFCTAMFEAFKWVTAGQDVSFDQYLIGPSVHEDPEANRLCSDLRDGRLRGVMLVGSVDDLAGLKEHPGFVESEIPGVVIQDTSTFDLPIVVPDVSSFLDRAIEYLRSKGRHRIAHLCMDFPWTQLEGFEQDIRRRGVELKPFWVQPVPFGPLSRGAAKVISMMMHLTGDDRPDALIVHDDNLVEHAVAGLLAAGVRVPDDLEVVTCCNFPSTTPSVMPIKRLGSDFRVLIKECFNAIEMQRRGEEPAPMKLIPAVFEEELPEDFLAGVLPGAYRQVRGRKL